MQESEVSLPLGILLFVHGGQALDRLSQNHLFARAWQALVKRYSPKTDGRNGWCKIRGGGASMLMPTSSGFASNPAAAFVAFVVGGWNQSCYSQGSLEGIPDVLRVPANASPDSATE